MNKKLVIPYGKCKKSINGEKVIEFYTDDQLRILKDILKDNLLLSTFALVLEKTGVRVSECLALKEDDIDLYQNRLRIDEAYKVDTNGQDEDDIDIDLSIKKCVNIGTTKSNNVRYIDMTAELKNKLSTYIEETNKNKKREETGLIFITEDGEPTTRFGMRRRYDVVLKKANCEIKFGFHKYRHTFGTKFKVRYV